MAFSRTWNAAYEAQPADTENISLGAGRIRDLKSDLQERLEIDHSHAGDADDGKHKQVTFLVPLGADPANIADHGFLYTKDVNSKVELFWEDEDGSVLQITSAGALTNPMNLPVVTKTADYPIVTGDKGKLFELDANAGDLTITLIAASGKDGFFLAFKAKDISNTITIDGNGAETIDGVASFTLSTVDEAVVIVCDGSTWHVVSRLRIAANKAAMEAASSTTLMSTPGQQQSHPLHPKAWGLLNGATDTVVAGSGITSIVKNSTGVYTVTLSIAMSSANYAVSVTGALDTTVFGYAHTRTTTTFKVKTIDDAGNPQDTTFSLFVFGDQ